MAAVNNGFVIEFSESTFERAVGRKPLDQQEFQQWAKLLRKGFRNGRIDWDIVNECTRDPLKHVDDVQG